MLVELRISPTRVDIHATGPDPRRLATHPRATTRGEHRIDPAHWDGLPDGHTRATTLDPADPADPADTVHPGLPAPRRPALEPADLMLLLARRDRLATPVARRDLATYQAIGDAPTDTAAAVLAFPTDRRRP